MKQAILSLILIIVLVACKTKVPQITGTGPGEIPSGTSGNSTTGNSNVFTPSNPDLQREITTQDSLFFDAYNNCKIAQMDLMFPDDIEFYHDQGGLSTSKPDLMKSLENNICNKVRRELLPGSIEVYPIPGYGAVQFGQHRFHNLVEKSTSRYSKFLHTWKNENGKWKLARVISLH